MKILQCSLPEREINNEVHAKTPASWNWLQFKICLPDQGSVRRIQNGSKWPPAIYLLVRTILHGVVISIMIVRPNLLCRLSMIPTCQLGIQKLHIHWKYFSGSGFIHTPSDISRPLRHWQQNDRPSIRPCLLWRYHRVTWITWSPLCRFPIHRIL